MPKTSQFNVIYNPAFKNNEWTLQVPSDAVKKISEDKYEVHLPVYISRALATGGDTLRPLRNAYRSWLLNKQNGFCAICGQGTISGIEWNLDHQPPLSDLVNSRFIDYDGMTNNRVIHQKCDSAQNKKKE